MTKEVMISLCGMQNDISEDETVEVRVPGQYFVKNETHYVKFKQYDENQQEMCQNILKIKHGVVELQRKGTASTRMHFEENHNYMSYYDMPHGNMLIETRTQKVDIDWTEDLICIKLAYDLYLNDSYLSNCDVSIRVESKG